jgi:hypothetical protein
MYDCFLYGKDVIRFDSFRANAHPSIKWGQKKDSIFLTIAVQDIDKPDIKIEPTKLHFKYENSYVGNLRIDLFCLF